MVGRSESWLSFHSFNPEGQVAKEEANLPLLTTAPGLQIYRNDDSFLPVSLLVTASKHVSVLIGLSSIIATFLLLNCKL